MASMLPKGPWSSTFTNEKVQQPQEDGDSLLTVLPTEEDRSALTILIADCTEVTRQALLSTFDAKYNGSKVEVVIDTAAEDLEKQLVLNPETDVVSSNAAPKESPEEKEKRDVAQREKELSSPKMKELKKESLAHFDAWREAVIQRVGEIVNSRETASAQKTASKPEVKEPAVRSSSPMRFANPPEYDSGVARSMAALYPPIETSLRKLPQEKKALILHSVLLLLLSLESYSSNSRVLLLRLSTSLDLPISFLAHDESKVARGLLAAAENLQAEEETKKAAANNQGSRRWQVGLATAAGAALIGITGGLAAPLLAAGIGSVMGGLGLGATAAAGYLGTLAGSSVLVGGLFGAYGGRMTGQMMDQYAREVEDFGFIPVRNKHHPRKIEKEYRRLRVAVGISGWLTDKDEVVEPWRVLGPGLESFALRWELEPLMNLGNALTSMISSAAWSYAKSEVIKRTVFVSLSAGLWPLALLQVSRVLDNPWSVANYRAVKAGDVLADALINKAQGERPITLVGYSLGAKVIFTCLQRLAERKAFGLVESVVLIGSPTPSTPADWRAIRAVTSGRVVNVFSTKDYILGFLYRGSSIQLGVAGLQAIENVAGVENVDVSEIVTGHTAYRFLTGAILRKLGFEDVDSAEVEKEQKALREEEAKEEEGRKESERKEKEKEKENTKKAPEQAAAAASAKADAPTAGDQASPSGQTPQISESQVKDLESEVERKNQQSYIGWVQDGMVSTGTNAAVAYEKAKAQWNLRSQGAAGKAAAGAARDADKATGDVNKATKGAGVDAPSSGDVAAKGMTAKGEAKRPGV